LIISAALLSPVLFAEESHESNGIKHPFITLDELQRHIGFFVLKYKDNSACLSKSLITAKDIETLHGLTGVHRVRGEGHDSLHSFQCFVKPGDRMLRYCFDFTVSPPARWDQFKSFEDLFNGRSLTQYYICRIEDGENTADAVDDIVIQSNTDDLAEKEKENVAEKLFSSPKAKAR
jgi:hypothetical protein